MRLHGEEISMDLIKYQGKDFIPAYGTYRYHKRVRSFHNNLKATLKEKELERATIAHQSRVLVPILPSEPDLSELLTETDITTTPINEENINKYLEIENHNYKELNKLNLKIRTKKALLNYWNFALILAAGEVYKNWDGISKLF